MQVNKNPYATPGSMYNHSDILWRMQNKAAISQDERAAFIAAHPEAFLAYMIHNNLANVNNTLRHEKGFEMLPYNPSKQQVESQIDLLIAKNNEPVLQDVINGFVFNPNANNWTTDADLVTALKSFHLIK